MELSPAAYSMELISISSFRWTLSMTDDVMFQELKRLSLIDLLRGNSGLMCCFIYLSIRVYL